MASDLNAPLTASRILVVDDEPMVVELIQSFLHGAGHDFEIAHTGGDGLRRAASMQPDLVLLDVHMPDMDGFDVCRQLRAQAGSADVPVIFITAAADATHIERAFAAGGSDYVRKPVEPVELRVRVDNQLQLRRARQRERLHVQQAEQFAQLGRLVGEMSHEIATPISNSNLAVSQIQENLRVLAAALDERRLSERALRDFVQQASEGIDIAQRSLEFSNQLLQSFKVVAVDQGSERSYQIRLQDYLENVLLSLRPRLKGRPIKVSIEGPPTLELLTQPGALAQIVMNLVGNSLQHGFPAGTAGTISIRFAKVGSELELRYQDDGAGMPAEHLSQVFDAYFTTRAGSGGSGLGMNIVHNLVTQRLGGRIECQSAPGQGVCFTLWLPLSE